MTLLLIWGSFLRVIGSPAQWAGHLGNHKLVSEEVWRRLQGAVLGPEAGGGQRGGGPGPREEKCDPFEA